MRQKLSYDVFETDLGWVAVVIGDRGVVRMCLPCASPDDAVESVRPQIDHASPDPEVAAAVRKAVTDYCAGVNDRLSDIPVDMSGVSPFFAKAWVACRTIPHGETRSYGWLAEQSGNARAARGAGQAMARNRVALLIPCHRVVASNGALHGFGGAGLPLKRRLLDMELS